MKAGPSSGPAAGSGLATPSAVASAARISSDRREAVRQRSIARYSRHAAQYDDSCARTWSIRERAVANLRLQGAQRVLDVGCGTGLSFALLRDGVGEHGVVIGIEQSPDMAALARERIAREGWRNVQLIESSAVGLTLTEPVDAVLFNYTHDVCQCVESLTRVFANCREGAQVSIAGVKFMPWWCGPLNLYVYMKNAAYNGSPGGLRRPWRHVQRWVPDLTVQSAQYGMGYLAHGRKRTPVG
ncbi:MAG: class I SAM-dependent methyltransferase [Burkholderiaceae bacterium]